MMTTSRNSRLLFVLVLLALSGCATDPDAGVESAHSEEGESMGLVHLSSDESELAAAFNAASDNVQLVLLLSPT